MLYQVGLKEQHSCRKEEERTYRFRSKKIELIARPMATKM